MSAGKARASGMKGPLWRKGLGGVAAAPDGGDEGDAGTVGEVHVAWSVEDDEVGTGADAEVADVGPTQGRSTAGASPAP